jgi:phenylpropionate dioxygenase-like ring-hydroxylating dioxygenase large terminal subunit
MYISNVSPELASWWHPVARAADIGARPHAVRLLGEHWVVARTDAGWIALADECPHRRAPLSEGRVVGESIECPYHGWQFGPGGACVHIPALGERAVLPSRAGCRAAWGVVERYGLVWVAPRQPQTGILELRGWDEPGRQEVAIDFDGEGVGAALYLDNQLDMGHFSFLHAGTFGTPEAAIVPEVEVVRQGWEVKGVSLVPIRGANDPAVRTGEHPLIQHRTMTWRYQAPFSLELRIDYPVMGGSMLIAFFVQPETERSSRLYTTVSFEYPGGLSEEALADRIAFERRVGEEDLQLQRKMRDLRLPLQPGAEVSTKADRLSIEYRRVLADLLRAAPADEAPMPATLSLSRSRSAAPAAEAV